MDSYSIKMRNIMEGALILLFIAITHEIRGIQKQRGWFDYFEDWCCLPGRHYVSSKGNSNDQFKKWYRQSDISFEQILSFFQDGLGTDDIIIFGRTLMFLKFNGSIRAVESWRDGIFTFEELFKGSIYK